MTGTPSPIDEILVVELSRGTAGPSSGQKIKRRTMEVGAALLVGVVAAGVGLHLWLLDGLDGALLGVALHEDTLYAAGYSDAGFRRVCTDMSEVQVEAILGPPESRWSIERPGDGPDAGSGWSLSPGDTHYRRRVILYRRGSVVAKHAEFYVD